MKGSEEAKAAMRAIALQEPSKELVAKVPDGDEWTAYVSAMFAGVLEKVFKDDQSHDAIHRFVDEMQTQYRHLDPPLKVLTLEGLIRVMFGEDHFLDEISGKDQIQLSLLTITKVVATDPEVSRNLEAYLNDGVTLADSWLAGD
ncbi:hypothetical protein [Glycomyces buryatensis]|uniref:Uncharacterized protein n=1 Tax=Glycomyces buryatensis TaxID=2570927 RepID=A0A4S8QDA5_9ACTN|nr:hypothetical protein [Glycomyces buryatensis]THV40875.1 hypothetical protein FAB82_13555 [Glycomyces buryatensis]